MNQQKIGKFIFKLRKEKGLTQAELAEKLGVTDRSVSNWENGKCMPDLSLFIPISKEFGITINDLMSGEIIDKKNYQEKMEYNFFNTFITLKKEINKHLKKIVIINIALFLGIAFGIVSFLLINEYKQKPIYLNYNKIDFKMCDYNDEYYKVNIKTNFDDLGIHINQLKDYTNKTLTIKAYRTKEENKNKDLLNDYGYNNQLLEKSIEKIYYGSRLIWTTSAKIDRCK